MAAEVTRDFATTCRVANMNRILQIERGCQLREIVGVGIEIISVPWLAGSPVAASIMCNAPIASLGQKEHLILECIRTQRPPMTENNRLPFAPILVVDLRSILCRDRAHLKLPPHCWLFFPSQLSACHFKDSRLNRATSCH